MTCTNIIVNKPILITYPKLEIIVHPELTGEGFIDVVELTPTENPEQRRTIGVTPKMKDHFLVANSEGSLLTVFEYVKEKEDFLLYLLKYYRGINGWSSKEPNSRTWWDLQYTNAIIYETLVNKGKQVWNTDKSDFYMGV